MAKYKKKKYNLGIQQIAVPQKGGLEDVASSTLSTASTGASIGGMFGPMGGAIGTGIGAATGLVKGVIDNANMKRKYNQAVGANKYLAENQVADDNEFKAWQYPGGTKGIKTENGYIVGNNTAVVTKASNRLDKIKFDPFSSDMENNSLPPENIPIPIGYKSSREYVPSANPKYKNFREYGSYQNIQTPIYNTGTGGLDSTKPIEVEKDELVFSRANGKYKLKADFQGGKTHSQGGEDFVAKEGDVIFPGKMREKVLKAYKSGNLPALETMRLTLPKDTKIARNGLDNDGNPFIEPRTGFEQEEPIVLPEVNMSAQAQQNVNVLPEVNMSRSFNKTVLLPGSTQPPLKYNSNVGQATSIGKYPMQKMSSPIDNSNLYGNNNSDLPSNGVNMEGVNGAIQKGLQAAPTIYNGLKGVFGKTAQPNRRFMSSEKYKYRDTSAPLVNASNEQQAVDMANANATVGSRGQALSYMSQASQGNYKRKAGIYAGEAEKNNNINNMNTQLTNQDKAMNLNLANQYDEMELMNKAKKSEYLGKGLEGASALSFNQELMNNSKDVDKMRMSTVQTSNYGYEDGLGVGYYAPDGSFKSGNKTYRKSGNSWVELKEYGTQAIKTTKYKMKK